MFGERLYSGSSPILSDIYRAKIIAFGTHNKSYRHTLSDNIDLHLLRHNNGLIYRGEIKPSNGPLTAKDKHKLFSRRIWHQTSYRPLRLVLGWTFLDYDLAPKRNEKFGYILPTWFGIAPVNKLEAFEGAEKFYNIYITWLHYQNEGASIPAEAFPTIWEFHNMFKANVSNDLLLPPKMYLHPSGILMTLFSHWPQVLKFPLFSIHLETFPLFRTVFAQLLYT